MRYAVLTLLSTGMLNWAAGSAAFADIGGLGCDPSWHLCMQTRSSNSDRTVNYLDMMYLDGQETDLPGGPDVQHLEVVDGSQDVVLQTPGQASVTIGRITQPIGANLHMSWARQVALNPGFDVSVSSEPGQQVTLCNQTATGFMYERYTYNTTNVTVRVTEAGNSIAAFVTNKRIDPYVSVHDSLRACENGQ